MSPLSPLSAAGLNLRSPTTATPSQTIFHSPIRQDYNDTDFQENILPSDPFLEEADLTGQSTVKASPRKTSPLKTATMERPTTPHVERPLSRTSDSKANSEADITTTGLPEEDYHTSNTSFTSSQDFNPDDTCFSAFSAVPNADMTAFARLAQSPVRVGTPNGQSSTTSKSSRPTTPGTAVPRKQAVSPSRSPPKAPRLLEEEATTQLLEFTEQMNYQHTSIRTPVRGAMSPPTRFPIKLAEAGYQMRSPNGRLANLLDFDLPPAPTPRSIPTITARELESLKAGFLSEVSSLKAKLSGATAELGSLKDAKDDAERRVGQLSEELREANGVKAALTEEKEDWQKCDKERQKILHDIKRELMLRENESSELNQNLEEQNKKLSEAETRAGDFEARLKEAESKLAGYRASEDTEGSKTEGNPETPGSGNKAVEVAVEKVARELHTLYKGKHEQKVSALKKSYEARWEKKVRNLESKVDELERENADLRVGRDATMSGVIPPKVAKSPSPEPKDATPRVDQTAELARLGAENETLRTDTKNLTSQLESMQKGVARLEADNTQLKRDLETARHENNDLVAAVDEMLALESAAKDSVPAPTPIPLLAHDAQRTPRPLSQSSAHGSESASRPAPSSKISGLRGPGFGGGAYGESRIGAGLKRSTSGNSGAGAGARSGIMSNIERMGRGIAAPRVAGMGAASGE